MIMPSEEKINVKFAGVGQNTRLSPSPLHYNPNAGFFKGHDVVDFAPAYGVSLTSNYGSYC